MCQLMFPLTERVWLPTEYRMIDEDWIKNSSGLLNWSKELEWLSLCEYSSIYGVSINIPIDSKSVTTYKIQDDR